VRGDNIVGETFSPLDSEWDSVDKIKQNDAVEAFPSSIF
jgi:hypothetical protein